MKRTRAIVHQLSMLNKSCLNKPSHLISRRYWVWKMNDEGSRKVYSQSKTLKNYIFHPL